MVVWKTFGVQTFDWQSFLLGIFAILCILFYNCIPTLNFYTYLNYEKFKLVIR